MRFLKWHGVSNYEQLNRLFSSLLRLTTMETQKLCSNGGFPHKGAVMWKTFPCHNLMLLTVSQGHLFCKYSITHTHRWSIACLLWIQLQILLCSKSLPTGSVKSEYTVLNLIVQFKALWNFLENSRCYICSCCKLKSWVMLYKNLSVGCDYLKLAVSSLPTSLPRQQLTRLEIFCLEAGEICRGLSAGIWVEYHQCIFIYITWSGLATCQLSCQNDCPCLSVVKAVTLKHFLDDSNPA